MVRERDWRYLVLALIGVDLACLTSAARVAAWLHTADQPVGRNALLVSAVMVGTAAVLLIMQGAYDPQNLLAGTREYSLVARSCVYGLAAVSLASFALQRPVSREWIGLFWSLTAALIVAARFLVRRVARGLRRRGCFTRRALVVGADANAVALAAQLGSDGTGMKVVGFLDDYHAVGSVLMRDAKVLGKPAALHQVAARTHAADAIIMPQALPWETLQRLIGAAAVAPNGLRVHLSAGFYDLLTTGVRLSECNRVPLLTVNKARLSRTESLIKSGLDYGLAIILLVGLAPAIVLMVSWQLLRGERHLLARRRVAGGSDGAAFDLLAFRSSAPFAAPLLQKIPGLLNVLAGQLSIIGPRPLSVETVPEKPVMSAIRPGLTGPWREIDDPAEQALLDLYYVRSYSIWLDIHVLVWRVLSHLRKDPRAFSRRSWAVGRWQ